MVTLDLTITNLNTTIVVLNDSTLQSQNLAAGIIYQWVDCNDSFAPITGETNTTFTTQNPGYYAVELILNNCSVISDCFTITGTTGVDALDTQYDVQLFPNPTKDELIISFPGNDVMDIAVIDIQGKVLMQKSGLFDQDRINLSAYVSGTYFVKIMNARVSRKIRVTKK